MKTYLAAPLLLAALALLACSISGCEDEDGKQRPIAAIVIRSIIFSKTSQTAAVQDLGKFEIDGPTTIGLACSGACVAEVSLDQPGLQVVLYEDAGDGPRAIASGDPSATEQCLAFVAQDAVYWLAIAAP